MKQFQELYPELDDENLFKKPKSRVSVCMNQEKRRTCNNDLYTHTHRCRRPLVPVQWEAQRT